MRLAVSINGELVCGSYLGPMQNAGFFISRLAQISSTDSAQPNFWVPWVVVPVLGRWWTSDPQWIAMKNLHWLKPSAVSSTPYVSIRKRRAAGGLGGANQGVGIVASCFAVSC